MGCVIVRRDRRADVVDLTIDRPEKRNALRAADCLELREAILSAARFAKVVTLSGAGGNFCSGADFGEMLSEDAEVRSGVVDAWTQLLETVLRAPCAVVAVVSGACVGGGHHLYLASDIALASEDAFFKNSGIDLNIVPMEVGTYLLPLMIGWKRAKAYVLSARRYSAAEALELGLCAGVTSAEELDELVNEWVDAICRGSRPTIRFAKAMLNQGAVAAAAPVSLSATIGASVLGSEESREGVQARVEGLVRRGAVEKSVGM